MNELVAASPYIWQAVGFVGFLYSLHLYFAESKPRPVTKADIEEALRALNQDAFAQQIAAELSVSDHSSRKVRLADNIRLHYDAKLEVW